MRWDIPNARQVVRSMLAPRLRSARGRRCANRRLARQLERAPAEAEDSSEGLNRQPEFSAIEDGLRNVWGSPGAENLSLRAARGQFLPESRHQTPGDRVVVGVCAGKWRVVVQERGQG